ncbi:MAG: GNAT family N-acetyltransferase, partial [Candidatus Micrarchaeota archaeon]|nr:GNAT family N-acetyltransferase [Candidatus Micrarchaeota archaeon]
SKTPYLWGQTKLGAEQDVWESLDKYARKAVRRSERDGVSVRELTEKDVDALYALYLSGMKGFGSPPMAKKFFERFFSHLVQKGLGRAFGAFAGEKLAAVLLGYTFQNRIHVIVNVSDESKRGLFVNDAVHWAFMQWGCRNGFAVFDWGRVREESGQHQFKKKWATVFQKLYHYYALAPGKKVPNADPTKGANRLLARAFKLVPTPLSRRVGPWLREGLGI